MPRPLNSHLFVHGAPWLSSSSKYGLTVLHLNTSFFHPPPHTHTSFLSLFLGPVLRFLPDWQMLDKQIWRRQINKQVQKIITWKCRGAAQWAEILLVLNKTINTQLVCRPRPTVCLRSGLEGLWAYFRTVSDCLIIDCAGTTYCAGGQSPANVMTSVSVCWSMIISRFLV